jgi:restriction endonuclease S subunit
LRGHFLHDLEIPLPPVAEQERLVAELEGYRKVIEAARQILAHYKPTLRIDPKWPIVELCSVSKMKRGPFGGSLKREIFVPNGYKVYEQKHAIRKDVTIGTYFIDEEKYKEMETFAVKPGDLIISCSGTMGCVFMLPPETPKGVINQALLKVTPSLDKVLGEYLLGVLSSELLTWCGHKLSPFSFSRETPRRNNSSEVWFRGTQCLSY